MLDLLGYLYSAIADIRNRRYESGSSQSHDLGARTISVGNITTGGTGKTPLVAHIAKTLSHRGERVCILTRGYGRKDVSKRVLVSDFDRVVATAEDAGDEPIELAGKLLGKAIVVADRDRVAAAKWAISQCGITAFILDDGFQHRRAKRDVDIVCIDATDPFGGGKVLPAGRLREPVSGLKRADAIVLTRVDLVEDLAGTEDQIQAAAPDVPVFRARSILSEFKPLNTAAREFDSASIHSQNAFAFCGLGNPKAFYSLLERENMKLAATHSFRDHHKYAAEDLKTIETMARGSAARLLLTTGKDAVKIDAEQFSLPCFSVEIEVEIDDANAFAALL